MTPKPARTIYIVDKGSNYLLLDSDDITPLYHVHWNIITLPHMTITYADPNTTNIPVGTANFIPLKTAGFSYGDDVTLSINGHPTTLTQTPSSGSPGPPPSSSLTSLFKRTFSTAKRFFQTSRGTTLCWHGGVAVSGFLKLVDEAGNTMATYKNTAYDGRRMGKIEIHADPLTQEELDEIVVSGIAMVSEQKVSMGQTAANFASAGAMG